MKKFLVLISGLVVLSACSRDAGTPGYGTATGTGSDSVLTNAPPALATNTIRTNVLTNNVSPAPQPPPPLPNAGDTDNP